MYLFGILTFLSVFYAFCFVDSAENLYLEKHEYYDLILKELKNENYNRESIDNLQAYVDVLKQKRLSRRVRLWKRDQSSRQKFQDAMCEEIMKNATPCSNPQAIFIGGGTASGKSSVAQKWLPLVKNSPCGYAYIDPDDVMTKMPEWGEKVKGRKCAAQELYKPAGVIALDCYEKCLAKNLTVVYDGTMSDYSKTMTFLNNAMKRGYELKMFGVTVQVSKAAERAWDRAQISLRYVPLCVVWSTHTQYSRNYANYTTMIPVNQLYDTNSELKYVSTLIFANNTVINQTLYDNFLAKANQTFCDVQSDIDNKAYIDNYDKLNRECHTCSTVAGCQVSNAHTLVSTVKLPIIASILHFTNILY